MHHSVASLRLFGDDLNPDEVSASLGAPATYGCRKGDPQVLRNGRVRIETTGTWRMEATTREPEDLEAQVFELLDRLTQDLKVWADLGSRFRLDCFCGIYMDSFNDGLPLSPRMMLALGERGIKLDLDIYAASDRDDDPPATSARD